MTAVLKPRWRWRLLVAELIIVGLGAAGCTGASPHPPVVPEGQLFADQVISLLDSALYAGQGPAWDRARAEAVAQTRGLRTADEAIPKLSNLLNLAGRGHTLIKSVAQQQARERDETMSQSHTTGRVTTLVVQGPAGSAEPGDPISARYEQTLAEVISSAAESGTCAWVVDMRNSSGGSYPALVAGMSQLLTDGLVASFRHHDGKSEPIAIDGGSLTEDGVVIRSVPTRPKVTGRIAVLTGAATASAGEITTIAFIGQSNVRLFGAYTAGLTTGNSTTPLRDGYILVRTDVVDVDRTGRAYGGRIRPDVLVNRTEDPFRLAEEWALQGC